MAMMNQPERRPVVRRGYRLTSVGGIEIAADWSLLIIFALVLIGLGAQVFPSWHPYWSPLLTWAVAAAAALGLIASIAVHELAHAFVANRNGVRVRRITLFVFGGMAHLEGEPRSPGAELRIAGVGPLVSFALGVVGLVVGLLLAAPAASMADPARAVASLGPVATILLWLGPINILLAMFNLLPGFPLDGGRVLRAVLWRITGSLRRATRWASWCGQALGWTLVVIGVLMLLGWWFPVLGGGGINGLWLMLIGWFLTNAARLSYMQLVVKQALDDVRVDDLVRGRPQLRVAPETTVAEIVNGPARETDATLIPVVHGETLEGVVDLTELAAVDREQWETRTAADVMAPMAEVPTLAPNDSASEALQVLSEHDLVPVVDRRDPNQPHLVGLLSSRDVARWMLLHGDDEIEPAIRRPL